MAQGPAWTAISKTNTNATSNSETYTYDGLNRLTEVDRVGTAYQTWSLDALGNMSTVTTAGVADYRQTNSRNQLLSMNATSTTVTAGSYLAYDQNGNVILDDHGYVLKYDAWNRLVTVRNLTGTLKSFAYDGLGRRIEDTVSGATTHTYFSAAWQVLEERGGTPTSVGSTAKTQYVWGPTYVDQLVLRTRDTDANGTLDEKLYVLQDANFDVTGIVDASGTVQERFVYDAYGKKTVLNAGWLTSSDSKSWVVGHQGLFEDVTIGWIHNRNRIYSVTMQRFGQQDPMGYIDGVNRYLYVGLNPINFVDSLGFEAAVATASTLQLTEITAADTAATGITAGANGELAVGTAAGGVTTTAAIGLSTATVVTVGAGAVVVVGTALYADHEVDQVQYYLNLDMAAQRERARVNTQIREWKASHPSADKSNNPATSAQSQSQSSADPSTAGAGSGSRPPNPPITTSPPPCPGDDLPKNPDDLLNNGYKETSHPDAKAHGHRTFENSQTGDKLRFDQGRPGKPGWEGTDHYHRYNPESTGDSDLYLDANGNPVPKGSNASHMPPQ